MASNTLQFTINLNGNAYTGIAQIDKALNKVNVNATKTESLMERINTAAFKINNIFGAVQNTIGKVSGAIEKVVEVGSTNELQKMNMTTLFKGNAEAAEEMFSKISEYGKQTVYDKAGLIDAQKTMMSFGLSGEKSFETLKQIGDIAMGDKQKMQSLALAFSQATSAGKLQGQDLMQLINAGFNPLQTISERTGESLVSLKDKMSKGQISAEMLAQAFKWATDENGLFYDGAMKAGTTTAGMIGQLQDSFDELLINIFNKSKPIIDTCLEIATAILGRAGEIINNWSSIADSIADVAPILIGVTGAIAAVTVAVQAQNIALQALIVWEGICKTATTLWAGAQSVLNAVMHANPIGLIIAGIALLVGAIVYVCKHLTGWSTLWDGVMGFMKYSFYTFVDAIKLYFNTYINGFLIGLDKIKLGWYKFKEACGIGDSAENQKAIASINADVEARQKAITDGAKAVMDNAVKAKESLAKGFSGMSWQSSSAKDKIGAGNITKTGVQDQLVAAANGSMASDASQSAMPSASQSTSAVATGGTRNTSITIKIEDMIKQVIFNGSTEDNKASIEKNFAECLYRVLGMAQNSI
ncbi:MAG: tape measure protein [Paludibacteraceae bacterium]|nr:tape measure protein [Paludibacteraceae bacterium]